uniref:TIL domain-containing protein n=1 Tax=Syphacia muris TaxID=451379 RepID=A0A158R4V3_9BILA
MVKANLIAVLMLIYTASASQDCPANMHFESCGSQCQRRCNEPAPVACTLACYIGCVCDEGYVLASDNVCVLPENCPAPSEESSDAAAQPRKQTAFDNL